MHIGVDQKPGDDNIPQSGLNVTPDSHAACVGVDQKPDTGPRFRGVLGTTE